MREAIGGTWLFQIVIAFVLLFTAFLCLSINHSKAFNVKNMIVNTIEREEYIDLDNPKDDKAIKRITNYLKETSYRTTGKCPTGYTGINRDGNKDNHNSAFCIKLQDTRKNNAKDELPVMGYYRIVVFYQLDLPIFNNIFNFKVTGDTRILSNSFTKDGYYRGPENMCQEYRNGKKYGNPKRCSSVDQNKIVE